MLTLSAGVIYSNVYGAAWGIPIAGVLGNLGESLGSMVAFVTGRYLLHGLLRRYFEASETLRAIDRTVKLKGKKISFLLRFSLLIPSAVANYGLSITDIPFPVFVFGFLGCLPWEFVLSYIGFSVGNLADAVNGNYSIGKPSF